MKANADDQSSAESSETLRGELAGGVVRGGGEARERPGEVAPFIDALKFAGAEDGVEGKCPSSFAHSLMGRSEEEGDVLG